MISRAAGRTATAAAAYRSGELIHDERTGLAFDYRARNYDASGELRAANDRDILHTEILAPANAPKALRDRATLWNEAEKAENRKDAQVARELLLALPHEFTHEQRVNLVRRFVQDRCVDRGMIADIAIHAPDTKGDQRNFHSHVLLTTRPVSEDGFAPKKDRLWNSKELLSEWRENWAEYQNQEFRRLGLDARVSPLSYEDQGSLKEPGLHLGPSASARERAGEQTRIGEFNSGVAARNKAIEPLEAEIRDSLNVIDASQQFFERQKLNEWKNRKREKLQIDQTRQQAAFDTELQQRIQSLEAGLEAEFAARKTGLSHDHDLSTYYLTTKGWRKVLRDLIGSTSRDKQVAKETEDEGRRIAVEEAKRRQQEHSENEGRRAQFKAAQKAKTREQEKRLQRAEERRKSAGYGMGGWKGR